jgi:signal transduction histidine kinase
MKKAFLSSHASIRTALLAILIVLGGGSIIASLQQINDSLGQYRQSRDLSEWAYVAAQLLTATQHLTYERGRTTVVLRSAGPITAKDRAFIDERRRLADAALAAALDRLKDLSDVQYADTFTQWQKVRQLRQQADKDFVVVRKSRDPNLSSLWFETVSKLIHSIQLSTEGLLGYFKPGEITTRLTLLAADAMELRITAGHEAALIAEALSAGEAPTEERLFHIHELRGREDRLWQEVERLVGYEGIEKHRDKAKEVKYNHLNVFRSMQDRVLSELRSGKKGSVAAAELTSASLPALDGISELMTMTTGHALRVADEGMVNALETLIRHIVWSVAIIFLLLMASNYVVRRVVKPLEQVDGELQRLGALPPADKKGNEIDRLRDSAEALERSLTARHEVETRLKRANEELLIANRKMHEYVSVVAASHTELEQAYKELQTTQSRMLHQEKMASIGQLAAGVAHEINNPLGFIISNLGTLGKYSVRLMEYLHALEEITRKMDLMDTHDDCTGALAEIDSLRKRLKISVIEDDMGRLVSESLEGCDRMKKIVQNLKSFARLDEHEFKMANINAALENTLNIIWNELKYKATVTKSYGEIPPTLCNPGELNQVFMNLLINAAQAIEDHGKISIETYQDGQSIFIVISDTGCGIPEDKLDTIFEPFFTTKEAGKGTGLGLSIVYDIIKKHAGEITVESRVGKGSRFTVRLPVRNEI